jgi:hypothetical protein
MTIVYNAIRSLQLAVTNLTGATQQDPLTWNSLPVTSTIQSQNLNRAYIKASVAIPYGAMINCFDSGGATLGIRLANALSTNLKPCHGYCSTVGGILAGAYGEVILSQGLTTSVGSMTVGTTYYLSTTDGLITNIKPSSPNLGQAIGYSLGTQILYFNAPMV